jgi:DUF1680 family protein
MPKQKRWAIKQSLDTILREIERAQEGLGYVHSLYVEAHPELAEELKMYFQGLEIAWLGILEFRNKI